MKYDEIIDSYIEVFDAVDMLDLSDKSKELIKDLIRKDTKIAIVRIRSYMEKESTIS